MGADPAGVGSCPGQRLNGRVVRGAGRGRQLGYPTANVAVDGGSGVRLDRGVYAAWVRWGEGAHRAVVNIGVRPTFGPAEVSVEVHVLDYRGDLYDKEVEVELRQRLREERSFATAGDLVAQIAADEARARALLAAEAGE